MKVHLGKTDLTPLNNFQILRRQAANPIVRNAIRPTSRAAPFETIGLPLALPKEAL